VPRLVAGLVGREQDLSNYLQMKDYKHAVELCLTLDKPRRLLAVFTEILDNGDSGRPAFRAALPREAQDTNERTVC